MRAVLIQSGVQLAFLITLSPGGGLPAEPDPSQVTDLYAHSVAVAEEVRLRLPSNPKALFDLARVHQRFGFDDRALKAYEDCLKADRNHPEVLDQIGFLLRQRFPEKALDAYREALSRNPEYPRIRTGIGMILLHEGRHREAVEELRAEIDNRSANALTYLLLGQALKDLGLHGPALRSFREAVRLDPEERRAYYGLAQVHQALGQAEEEARARAEFVKRKDREDLETEQTTKKGGNREEQLKLASLGYLDAAQTYEQANLAAEAERAASTSLRFHPRQLEALKLLIDLYRRERRFEAALARSREFVAAARSPEVLYLQAGLCGETGSFEEAAALLEEVIQAQPLDSDARRELARLILRKKAPGGPARALELARGAVHQSPTAINYEVMGWALWEAGDRQGGLEAASIAVGLEPENPVYRQREAELRRMIPR